LNEFKNGTTIFEFFSFLILSVVYFTGKLQRVEKYDFLVSKKFWVLAGLFVYFSGNFFYMLLVEISKFTTYENKQSLTIIYCTITILKNLIISIGLSLPEKSNNPDNFLPFAEELELNTHQNNPNPG
jgi:hypothetical protein